MAQYYITITDWNVFPKGTLFCLTPNGYFGMHNKLSSYIPYMYIEENANIFKKADILPLGKNELFALKSALKTLEEKNLLPDPKKEYPKESFEYYLQSLLEKIQSIK